MNALKLLQYCAQHNIHLKLDENEQLQVTGNKSALTPVLIEQLKAQKTELIALLAKRHQPQKEQAIPLADRTRPLPLSFAQQRLWFVDQLDPGSSKYNVPVAFKLKGAFNMAAFEQVVQTIVARHEMLRTSFVQQGNDVVQQVNASASAPIFHHDLSQGTEKDQESQLTQLLFDDINSGFDLTSPSLFRLHLVRLSDNEHAVIWNMHHIITDGWSTTILIEEIIALYDAFCRQQANPLPPLSVQYADYAVWQRGEHHQAKRDSDMAYWRTQLHDLPQCHSLPLDYPRGSAQSFNGEGYPVVLPKKLQTQLNQLCLDNNVTLFMLLQSSFALLLKQFSGESDIVMGTPTAGRSHRSLNSLIGFFVNTLVLRTSFLGNPTFSEFLQQNKTVHLNAFEHQHVPFEMLVETLQPQRSLSHSPLFQIMFSLQNAADGELALGDLEVTFLTQQTNTTKFDLTLAIKESDEGLYAHWEYCTDLFAPSTIANLAQSYEALLQSIVSQPDTCIDNLGLLSPEQRDFLAGLNPPKQAIDHGAFIQDLVAQQANLHPHHIALVMADEHCTYAQLEQRSNQLAHYLMQQSVGFGDKVGIATERSINSLVAILATLKTGAAYVPIAQSIPNDRKTFMLQDADVNTLIIDKNSAAERFWGSHPDTNAESDFQGLVVSLTELTGTLAQQSTQSPVLARPVLGTDLAYVIYTSGTTGLPKGVMNHHKGLANLIQGANALLKLDVHSRSLQVASFAFDAAVWDWVMALGQGAQLHIITDEMAKSPALLDDYVATHQLTHCFLTPALLPYLTLEKWQSVQTLYVGGDSCAREMAEKWSVGRRFFNAYGPSETAVCVAMGQYQAGDQWLDIGPPLAGCQLYLVNAQGNLLPPGAKGELCIAGNCVGLGYIHQAALNASQFVRNPFANVPSKQSAESNAILYKTGDMARWLPDGTLLFLGRQDNQVKIRGFRIELGEITSQINALEAVSAVEVVVNTDVQGQKRLVAYLTSDSALSDAELASTIREALGQVLPDYMLPAAFIRLAALPLTPNGKVDVRALAAQKIVIQDDAIEPLSTPEETQIAQIMASILDVDAAKLGRNAHFFKLGGHSLLAVRLLSEIQEAFGVSIKMTTLFEGPTVWQLASQVAQHFSQSQSQSQIVPVQRHNGQPETKVLSYAQQRLWFIDKLAPESTQFNMPSIMRLTGSLNRNAFEHALSALITRHEVLRCRYWDRDGQPALQIEAQPALPLTFEDLSTQHTQAQSLQLDAILKNELARPFNLSHDSVIRVQLIKLAATQHVLVLNVHHIACDGWSMELLINELSQLYSAFAAQKSAALAENTQAETVLPALDVQYLDFAHWQKTVLSGEKREQELGYWRQQLAGIPELHRIPTDFRRPDIQDHQGHQLTQTLSPALSEQVLAFCQRFDVTPFVFLQSCFSLLLSRYSHETDIVMATPVAGRHNKQTESLIGLFINNIILRTDVSAEQKAIDFLQHNKTTLLQAYEHQDIPFELIVEALQPSRQLSYQPLAQVMINYFESSQVAAPKMTGLEVSVLQDEPQAINAKQDLTLYITKDQHQFEMNWVYATALFAQHTIAGMMQSYRALIEAFIHTVFASPQARLQNIQITCTYDAHTLAQRSGFDPLALPEHSILAQIEHIARHTPDAIAVAHNGQALSYGQLVEQATQVAAYLINQGVAPGDVVAIHSERCIAWVAAVLGVLKSGAVYLPLACDLPLARLQHMISDASPRLILCSDELQSHLPTRTPVHGFSKAIAKNAHQNQPYCSQFPELSDNMASHIIYTSGSTGTPKGVLGSHGSLKNRVNWMLSRFPFADNEAQGLITSISFIRAIFELLTPLAAGSRVEIIDKTTLLQGEPFIRAIANTGISRIVSAPSLARTLVDLPEAALLFGLRYWFISGEPFKPRLASDLCARLPQTTFCNLYGSTECASDVSYFIVNHNIQASDIAVPLGQPIANTGLIILDEQLRPVPDGMPGELCVAGNNLALAYLNAPELTQEKFAQPDLGEAFGERIYRTGDRVRRIANAQEGTWHLEYLGRLDDQIKVRGFRIEPGEIEHKILALPDIKDARVIVRAPNLATQANPAQTEQEDNNAQLVAYLIAKDTLLDDQDTQAIAQLTTRIKDTLQGSLPDYMVPVAFVFLPAFPLRANGKVDKSALPEPQIPSDGVKTAPRDDVERVLCQLWQDMLGKEQVGIEDNFFKLGGHSLLAMRMLSAIRQRLNVDISIQTLFANPSLSGLAKACRQSHAAPQESITVIDRTGKLPLSFSQQRLWFIDQVEGGSAQYNIASVNRLVGELDVAALEQAFARIIERHEVLRSEFKVEHDDVSLVIHAQVAVPLTQIDLRHFDASVANDDVNACVSAAFRHPFDLAKAPLLQLHLLRLGETEHVLIINMHHIISDGWSTSLLLQEFTTEYNACLAGEPSPIPALPVQYVDYAHWQKQRVSGAFLQQQMAYWQQQLAHLPTVHSLPLNFQRPATQTFAGRRFEQSIDAKRLTQLRQLAHR